MSTYDDKISKRLFPFLPSFLTEGFAEYMSTRLSLKSSSLKWAPQTLVYLDGGHRVFFWGRLEGDLGFWRLISFLMAILHLRFTSVSEGNWKRWGSAPLHLGTTHGAGMIMWLAEFTKYLLFSVRARVVSSLEIFPRDLWSTQRSTV